MKRIFLYSRFSRKRPIARISAPQGIAATAAVNKKNHYSGRSKIRSIRVIRGRKELADAE